MIDSSRRSFLKSAGIVAAGPGSHAEAAPLPRVAAFAPRSEPRKLSDNLFVFEDTCNVYVVRSGASAVLIDFGSGKILDHLPALGISKVDWILHTHHHRDQCQGDARAASRRIPIAVPLYEQRLFEDAENFWRNRRVFHLYYMRNDFNTITRNIPVERGLVDYTTFRWKNVEFRVMPAPGHTLGSIALVAVVDGKRTAFSGDLMYAPGKVLNLYDTQVYYAGTEGIDLGIYSLSRLRELKPELLCPSHGEPIANPDGAMAETVRRLAEYQRFQSGEPAEFRRPFPVSPHLVAHHETTASFYAIISDSGKGLFVDYGSASSAHFHTLMGETATDGRMRFVEHSIDRLKREYGLKSVDVAIPTHMHDDHINGFPHLARRYGTRIWCYENMVDVLERPRGQNLGCGVGEPMKVSRAFRHGETFRWEEFEFEMTHSPGHTEYQMALYATIDGNRIAFTGDAFFEKEQDGALRHNLIFRNHVENDSHLKSIRNLIEHEPALICPGHGKPFAVDRQVMLTTLEKFKKQQQFFFDLLPDGESNFGLDPSWVSIYPYQILLTRGEPQTLELRVRNYGPQPMKVEIALVAPVEWRIEPDVVRFEIPAGTLGSGPVSVTAPAGWNAPGPRFAIAADVLCDGKYLGEITEAVVDLRG
jgi:glyoxylase-like metal-dependent hydrolase (beta-lactamase superfamily II)